MKKLAAFILLLVYFTVTTGFVVSVHYCMNKLSSVELGYSGSNECSKCGMHLQKSNGCCKDDVKVVKMQVDHNFSKTPAPDFSLQLLPVSSFETYVALPVHEKQSSHPFANGPPLSAQNRYLLHCVFRL